MKKAVYQNTLSDTLPKGTGKGLVITAIAAVLALVVYKVLPYEANANKGLALLTFIAVLWLSEAIHITITALMIPVLAVAIGIPEMTTQRAFSSFADPIIFLFFGGFALATALHVQQLDRKIALWLISISKGHLGVASLVVFGVTAFLSMWISNTATAAMMLPLVLGMLSHLDRDKDRSTFVFVLLGVAYSASIGGLGSLVGSPPNAIAAKALGLDFAGWMKLGLPMMLVILPAMIAVMYLVLRPNLNQPMSLEKEYIPWTLPRVLTMIVFVCTAAAWIFGTKLKDTFGITNPDTWVAVTAAIVIVLLGLANWKQISDNTDWGILFLFGGGIALSAILSRSGASAVLGAQVANSFVLAHPFIVVLASAAFIVFLTEFTSNTASAALLVPIFAAIAPQLGVPQEALVMVIALGASCAFMLPVATPPNAIVFGTGLIRQQEMVRVGVVLNVICVGLIGGWAYLFLL